MLQSGCASTGQSCEVVVMKEHKYTYLVLDIFSGKFSYLDSNNRYKDGSIVKGFQIKDLIKINY